MRISVIDWLADCCSGLWEAAMETRTEVARVTPQQVERRRGRGEAITFVDARNPQAWSGSDVKLPGAIRVPAEEVGQHLREIRRDRPVVVYCT